MELLQASWEQQNSACVGLDPHWPQISDHLKAKLGGADHPGEVILRFNQAIIEATADVAGIYKPQWAFYGAHGAEGVLALKQTVEFIHKKAPGTPVILDAKRLDIGKTNLGYVAEDYDYIGVDALTLHNYLGREAAKPFLDRSGEGAIFMCKTSNPGAGEFQDLMVEAPEELGKLVPYTDAELESSGRATRYPTHVPLYQLVAYRVSRFWNGNGNCGLVVGATYPYELKKVRQIVGDGFPILIPGAGDSQGGDLTTAAQSGTDSMGHGMIINMSSDINFASGGDDFADAARAKAIGLRDGIRSALKAT